MISPVIYTDNHSLLMDPTTTSPCPGVHIFVLYICVSISALNEIHLYYLYRLYTHTHIHTYICCVLCLVTQLCPTLQPHELWPASHLGPWGISSQEIWSGLSCPLPEDLPNPGIEPRSPALQVDILQSEPPGKYIYIYDTCFTLSDLLYSVRQSLGPSISLQMAQFHPFYG